MSKNSLLRAKNKGFSCMSLILDALNRAENERKNQNAVPDLNTLHSPQEFNAAPGSRRILWWVVGVVLVLIAIIITLIVLLRREPSAQTSIVKAESVQQTVTARSTGPVVEQTTPAAASISTQNPPIESTSTSTTAVVSAAGVVPDVSTPNANAAIDQLYSTKDDEPQAVVDTGVNELYAAEAATAATSETIVDPFNATGNATDSAVIPSAVEEQAPPRTFDSIKNIPDFNSLPWNMRQQIPTITYARHNFLGGGLSSVVINNQTTGVGNIIGTGQFVVQEIYVDGVILKHGNAVFKLRALNGWINM